MNSVTKIQFDILCILSEQPNCSIDELSRLLYQTPERISCEHANLVINKFIQDNMITPKALGFLKCHKIENAIILAAGMSTRFVPLSYEKPKGLLTVKGEILIERQIHQLREKGIEEIVIVVGHMKEKFYYLQEKYGVILVETTDYIEKNNHASVYAARAYLKNSIITSSDLYFSENIFQRYAFDAYYCAVFVSGKTAERGIETDADDRIIKTMYGDKCYDIWVTFGYAFFSKRFSDNFLKIIEKEFDLPETAGKFWADIQDEHLNELFMYAKRVNSEIIYEFDTLEELRDFDNKYRNNSGSRIMKRLCKLLAASEKELVGMESLHRIKPSMFLFRYKGDTYICDMNAKSKEKVYYNGRVFYMCNDAMDEIRLYKMEKYVRLRDHGFIEIDKELNHLYVLCQDFKDYHKRALPLCAAENVISPFANLPLSYGFQERYIMNNTYSFNMDDNFIGCEKLFPFYQMISDSCERLFGAIYTDSRPFTGMQTLDMIAKTVCQPGDRVMILDKEYGGHASVKPVLERLGIQVYSAPYIIETYDLDYDAVNEMIRKEQIEYILLAPSDLIKPLDVEKIDTENCVLLWDASQILGLIAAGLAPNPLKNKRNVIVFGGTHKTFPGPASGLIMTNEKYLHDRMEKAINPKYLRHSQMHQKICLLFALLEFEEYGDMYMSHILHCSNYLGMRLKEYGFDIADYNGRFSSTHQIFIRCSQEEMETIYENAYRCEVTLNKKQKALFKGFGIRLGTQEIARYDWNDAALDRVAYILNELKKTAIDYDTVLDMVHNLPEKKIYYTFPDEKISNFYLLMNDVRHLN